MATPERQAVRLCGHVVGEIPGGYPLRCTKPLNHFDRHETTAHKGAYFSWPNETTIEFTLLAEAPHVG